MIPEVIEGPGSPSRSSQGSRRGSFSQGSRRGSVSQGSRRGSVSSVRASTPKASSPISSTPKAFSPLPPGTPKASSSKPSTPKRTASKPSTPKASTPTASGGFKILKFAEERTGSDDTYEAEEFETEAEDPEPAFQDMSTQTSDGRVSLLGAHKHKNPLQTPPVPSKAEAVNPIMELVKAGLYDDALAELEGREDSEALWYRNRIIARQNRIQQGSFLSSTTWPLAGSVSSIRTLTSTMSTESLGTDYDESLPDLKQPSGEEVAFQMLKEFAECHQIEVVDSEDSTELGIGGQLSWISAQGSRESVVTKGSLTSTSKSTLVSTSKSSIGSRKSGRSGRRTAPPNLPPWVHPIVSSPQSTHGMKNPVHPYFSTSELPALTRAATAERPRTQASLFQETLGVKVMNSPMAEFIDKLMKKAQEESMELSRLGTTGSMSDLGYDTIGKAPKKSSVRVARELAKEAAEEYMVREGNERAREEALSASAVALGRTASGDLDNTSAPDSPGSLGHGSRTQTRIAMAKGHGSPLSASSFNDDVSRGGSSPLPGQLRGDEIPRTWSMGGPHKDEGNQTPVSLIRSHNDGRSTPGSRGQSPPPRNLQSPMHSPGRRSRGGLERKSSNKEKKQKNREDAGAEDYQQMQQELQKMNEFWGQNDHILANLEGVGKTRREGAGAVQNGIKNLYAHHDKSKITGMVKAAIKRDDVGRMLEEEIVETKNMHSTLSSIQEMAAKLAGSRADRAKKKIQEAENVVKKAQEEANRAAKRYEKDQQHAINTLQHSKEAKAKVQEMQVVLDRAEEDVRAGESMVESLRMQVAAAESKAFLSSSQGLLSAAKEQEGKALRLRKEYQSVRDRVLQKMQDALDLKSTLESNQEDAAEIETLAAKESLRAEETKKTAEKEKKKVDEFTVKLQKEMEASQILITRAKQQQDIALAARQQSEALEDQPSGFLVTDRLRAKSLVSIAKNLLSAPETAQGKDSLIKDPVYVGQKVDGVRTGFGVIEYPEGGEYRGQWESDLPHGSGIERYVDGTSYEGSFARGTRNGLGVYTLSNGLCYMGHWRMGQRQGAGIMAVKKRREHSYNLFPISVCVSVPPGTRLTGGFKTETMQHCQLLYDANVSMEVAIKIAKHAQQHAFGNYFNSQEQANQEKLKNMGLEMKQKNPLLKAFEQSEAFLSTRERVVAKTKKFMNLQKVLRTFGGEQKGGLMGLLTQQRKKEEPASDKRSLAEISKKVGLAAMLKKNAKNLGLPAESVQKLGKDTPESRQDGRRKSVDMDRPPLMVQASSRRLSQTSLMPEGNERPSGRRGSMVSRTSRSPERRPTEKKLPVKEVSPFRLVPTSKSSASGSRSSSPVEKLGST